MRWDWVTQISDSYSKWIEAAAVSKNFPQSMLSLNDRHQIHLNLVTATDFLGKTYRAYEDLIMADPTNCHAHLANCDKDLERVRKCFRCIETFAISDNYYRSVSGLPPAPYPECQSSQAALEQNTPEYLTSLANFKVGSILRVMEQPEMYADSVEASNPSTPTAPKTAQEVIQAYMRHVYRKFGGSEKILLDNGTEFKNTLFEDIAKKLGVEYKVYMPPYRLQCNSKI